MIRRLYIFLILVAGSTIFSSCCHKKGCIDADKIETVRFNGFQPSELDTLVFTSFTKNSAFAIKIDSFFIFDPNNPTTGVKEVNLPVEMDQQFDWQIKLPGTNAVYRINEFVQQENVCNRCITGNDYYRSLETYKINGVAQVGNIINVQK